jgi:hypothetical protein
VTSVRALLAAAVCACVLAIVPGPALAHQATSKQALPAVAVQAAVDQLQADANADHVADRPEVGGLTVKRQSRKPRRTNRRLRVRHGHGAVSGRARVFLRAGPAVQLNLKSKRHKAKRALMRRLMAVRGGLQA